MNYRKYSISNVLPIDNLGHQDSDSEDERQSVSHESGADIPDINRLLINPYKCVILSLILWIIYYGVFSSNNPVCNANANANAINCESEESFVTALDEKAARVIAQSVQIGQMSDADNISCWKVC